MWMCSRIPRSGFSRRIHSCANRASMVDDDLEDADWDNMMINNDTVRVASEKIQDLLMEDIAYSIG